MNVAVTVERWPIQGGFRIARGRKTQAEVVVVELSDDSGTGRGEGVPYGRYGETIEGVVSTIEGLTDALAQGLTRTELQRALTPGAARNALDCAMWDLQAKRQATPVWQLAKMVKPKPVATALTIDLCAPDQIAARITSAPEHGWLKLKLDDTKVLERVRAAREATPKGTIIVDANESWSVAKLRDVLPGLAELSVGLIEQPLPASEDAALRELEHLVPICADESFHDRQSFDEIQGLYDAVNIKLDKCGGLTEATAALEEATRRGFRTMVGCMVGTSLSIAPALLIAGRADYVDLDGSLLLSADRAGGVSRGEDGTIAVADDFWGGPA